MSSVTAEIKRIEGINGIVGPDGVYRPAHKIRFVTAASLFDGHDASINIMRLMEFFKQSLPELDQCHLAPNCDLHR